MSCGNCNPSIKMIELWELPVIPSAARNLAAFFEVAAGARTTAGFLAALGMTGRCREESYSCEQGNGL